jgi:hypothetical protein
VLNVPDGLGGQKAEGMGYEGGTITAAKIPEAVQELSDKSDEAAQKLLRAAGDLKGQDSSMLTQVADNVNSATDDLKAAELTLANAKEAGNDGAAAMKDVHEAAAKLKMTMEDNAGSAVENAQSAAGADAANSLADAFDAVKQGAQAAQVVEVGVDASSIALEFTVGGVLRVISVATASKSIFNGSKMLKQSRELLEKDCRVQKETTQNLVELRAVLEDKVNTYKEGQWTVSDHEEAEDDMSQSPSLIGC